MNTLCNTLQMMSLFEGKRVEFIGVKFNNLERFEIEKIANTQDRSLSYIVRELALRGLIQYFRDGLIKSPDSEILEAIDLLRNRKPEIKPLGAADMQPVETLTQKAKTPKAKTG